MSRYLRGSILKEMREFPAAIDEFKKARELSVELDDTQGIAFADMDICAVQIEIGQLAEARKRCDNALRIFTAAKIQRSRQADVAPGLRTSTSKKATPGGRSPR